MIGEPDLDRRVDETVEVVFDRSAGRGFEAGARLDEIAAAIDLRERVAPAGRVLRAAGPSASRGIIKQAADSVACTVTAFNTFGAADSSEFADSPGVD